MSKNVIEVNARLLADALAAVIPHASDGKKRDEVPALNAVRFDVLNNELVLVASDRFTLVVHRVVSEPLTGTFTPLNVALEEAKKLERIARKAHRIHFLHLSSIGDYLVVRNWDGTSEEQYATMGHQYPEWRTLIASAVDRHKSYTDPADYVIEHETAFNPQQLARFAKVHGGKTQSMLVQHGRGGKPTLFACEDFVGLIMPHRPVDAMQVDDWVPGRVSAPVIQLPTAASQ